MTASGRQRKSKTLGLIRIERPLLSNADVQQSGHETLDFNDRFSQQRPLELLEFHQNRGPLSAKSGR